jgi:hypothetical protein
LVSVFVVPRNDSDEACTTGKLPIDTTSGIPGDGIGVPSSDVDARASAEACPTMPSLGL